MERKRLLAIMLAAAIMMPCAGTLATAEEDTAIQTFAEDNEEASQIHYKADFSTEKPESWTLGEGFTVKNGILQNDWANNAHMNAKSACDAYWWSGCYTYSADVYNEGGQNANSVMLLFNYKDAYNYYSVQIGGGTSGINTYLKKTVGGNTETIAIYTDCYTIKDRDNLATIKITYDNGIINVVGIKNGEETVLFENVKDATLTAGKIGVGGVDGVGWFSNIRVDGYGQECVLKQVTQSISEGETDVELLPEIRVGFNMPLDRIELSQESVSIYSGDEKIRQKYYSVAIDTADTSVLVIKILRDLKAKTDYRIVVGKDILSQEYGEGLREEFVINFKTRTADFDIESAEFLNEYGSSVAFYPPAFANRTVIAKISVVNRGKADAQPYAVGAVLMNEDGEQLWSKIFTGTLDKGESAELSEEFKMPAQVKANAKFLVYAWDGLDTMKVLESSYPAIAFADSDFIEINENKAESEVIVSGTLPNKEADRLITLLVTNPGKSLSDEDAIQHQAQITTGEDGEFTYTFTLNPQYGSGAYGFKFGGDDFAEVKSMDYYYALAQDIENAIADINAQTEASQMAEKLEEYKATLAYNIAAFNETDHARLADKVLAAVKENPFTDDKTLSTFVKTHALLEAYSQQKRSIAANSDNILLNRDLLELDGLDAKKSLSVVEFYDKKLSRTGRGKVLDSLLGKKYAGLEDFYKVFTESVVVYGVCNCEIDGYAHISELLNKNGAAAGLNLSNYNSSRADKLLVQKNIESISSLQTEIDNLSKAPVQTSGGGSGGSGGKTSSFSWTSSDMTLPATTPVPIMGSSDEKEIVLNDMEGCEWALPAVKHLMKERIIAQPLDGMYRPSDNITREEFTKMLVLAAGVKVENTESTFEDLGSGDWSMPYVMAAKKEGIVSGIDATHFGGKRDILRQDAAAIICRAFRLAYAGEDTSRWDFDDISDVSDYAVEPMRTMVLMGMINGVGERTLSPKSNCTRAEAAQLIYNALCGGGVGN